MNLRTSHLLSLLGGSLLTGLLALPAPAAQSAAPAAKTVSRPNAGTATKPAAVKSPAEKSAAQPTGEKSGVVPKSANEPTFSDAKLQAQFDEDMKAAIDLFKQNKKADALPKFQEAFDTFKQGTGRENVGVLNWIASTQQGLNKWEDARQTLEKVIDLDPTFAQAHNNLAYTYQHLNQLDKAADEYRQAAQLLPNLVEPRYNLANVLLELKKPQEASKEFDTVLTMNPKPEMESDAIYKIGTIAQQNKDYDRALQYYTKALEKNKKNPAVLTRLGAMAYEQGDKQRAEDLFNQALDINPQFYDALLHLGIINLDDKHLSPAIGFFGKALEVNPYDAEVHFWLGKYYLTVEQYNNSIKQFGDCLKCDPSYPEAQACLDKVVAKKNSL